MNRYQQIKDHVWGEVYALTYARWLATNSHESSAEAANTAANEATERMLINHDLSDLE